jgi:hypothetical protein
MGKSDRLLDYVVISVPAGIRKAYSGNGQGKTPKETLKYH